MYVVGRDNHGLVPGHRTAPRRSQVQAWGPGHEIDPPLERVQDISLFYDMSVSRIVGSRRGPVEFRTLVTPSTNSRKLQVFCW
ncbi:hypothetical protein Mapa_000358 [Marchantia paleacea]|nr:hypothetical protein Mapa_000358 [Marchantia paleacea]